MNINNAFHEITAVAPAQYPQGNIPEVVLAGRSNAGKSSLINTLLGRKKLARVGSSPGKTRQINFYNIDNTLRFVDFPGYGYAKVSKTEQMSWGKLTNTYLSTRKQLAAVILVLDIRHEPSEHDQMMYDWIIQKNMPFVIAATRCDKLPRTKVEKAVLDMRNYLDVPENIGVIAFSAINRWGKDELWKEIIGIAGIS
jgi:GTP-binding protein